MENDSIVTWPLFIRTRARHVCANRIFLWLTNIKLSLLACLFFKTWKNFPTMFLVYKRTKWKRQATVGIELLTEAGNIAAMQSLCARLPWMHHHPPPPALTPPTSSSFASSLGTNMDFYYRHAAALATLRPPPFVSTWNGSASAEEKEESSEAAEDKLLDQDKS